MTARRTKVKESIRIKSQLAETRRNNDGATTVEGNMN